MAKQPSRIYQIKVSLDDTHPPIWRRILVPGNTTLLKLHDILQIVMGWGDCHLHSYTIDGLNYGNPEDDEYGDFDTINEANYSLNQVIYGEGQRFSYEYDFGDSWDHTLLVEKILSPEKGSRYPLCVKGKRACPPDDVGGVWGYENFLDALSDPDHAEHEEYLEWIGGTFDAESFDLEGVNAELHSMGRGRSTEAQNSWNREDAEPEMDRFDLASSWSQKLPDEQRLVAENLPLRRDMITLLTYLRDNKITGTQSTGNLPLKAMREICPRFVKPPLLEVTIGGHVYKARSESDVWVLYFRHVLASIGELVTGGMGRRWVLTPLGERFLTAPAPLQVWLLYVTWWTQINWIIASPYNYADGYFPAGFRSLALRHLLDLPTDDGVLFEPFADRMIKEAGLVWAIQDQDVAHSILSSIIDLTVINPQVDFGVLLAEYEPHKTLGAEYHELSTIKLTSFGRGLLGAIKETFAKEL